jgi:hypothetical protein
MSTAPEAVGSDISSVVGAVHWEAILVQRRLFPVLCCPPYIDEGFGGYSGRGEGLLAEAGPLIGHVVVPDVDQASLLALKGMVNAEALATSITVRREVQGREAEPEAEIVEELSELSSVTFI